MAKKSESESQKSLQDVAIEFLISNPNYAHDTVLVTADGQCFEPTIKGSNSASNHAKLLDDNTIIEVNKK